ncbi:aminotransferase class V-fold PLP-dependent enzyme [Fulvivirga lutimaris]|uniref:aminotransferase class V-fold PLP-dependent enzyme n=1 Tax=Fulvivirga lutimaris TaxID=1819566 RepID=UPI0012BB9027|nr:aminotransferase class V-fold PLP-dependent enzyme [Fulvivirga lutimaris]MTI40076.1 aminotransferase class V-fold PLP-dependent enzyme [Fulvivirga lutimaris]
MITFYPGPSRVYDKVPKYVKEAFDEGILSINHRSPEFMSLLEHTNQLVKKKLNVPDDYQILYLSSATECWQVIAQSYDGLSYHFYNGAFGKKWFENTKKIKPLTIGYHYDMNKVLNISELDLSGKDGLICLTQNETSNGTCISNKRIAKIRKEYTDHIIAVDATSSLGGAKLNIENADIWYASVQKCFGLPAGMSVMICSPKALSRRNESNKYYNSLNNIVDNASKSQTTHTPNVLNLYLLNKVLSSTKNVAKISQTLQERMKAYLEFFDSRVELKPLIANPKVRSETVLVLQGNPEMITKLKEEAREEGIILGNGYGEYKNGTFRIANFPAIKNKEVQALIEFLDKSIN